MIGGSHPDIVILDGRVFTRTEAKRLAVGDLFVPDEQLNDALEHDYAWRVRSHEFTARGDYSTFIESDDTEWSERFEPDETVWILTTERTS